MQNETSSRLLRLTNKIMKAWELRALEEVDAAIHQKSLALRDSLPEFLGHLAKALLTTVNRTEVRIKWDLAEGQRIGKKHGRERAASINYTIDQLIFEYHILRQVIFDVMEEEAPISPIEREIIICGVEQAVNDAATEFSDTLRDIQEKFTFTLAHDLCGPIAATLLSTDILNFESECPTQVRLVSGKIRKSMDRLDFMIHDLLDASRLRAGEHLTLLLHECDFNATLTQAADEANFLLGNRVKLISPGKVVGQWNEKALRRIVDNLLGNAFKFSTPKTPITIELKNKQSTVELSVHNIGESISRDEQEILFQQFRRVRTSEGKMGWGLGLTVVKGLTEAHLGKVVVESSPETGTIFRVTLPVKNENYPIKISSRLCHAQI